jgi:CRP/FNR family cyclic AMP-dependent transcriptional regulator
MPATLLRNVTIFQDLPEGELEELARRMTSRNAEKDEVIVTEHQPGDSLFVISNGKVKVSLSSEKGREVILSVLGAGDFFGEMSLLDGEPRSARVTALRPTQLNVLSRDGLVDYLMRSPQTALKIMAEMSRRLRRADEIIGNLALLDVYGRVARILLDLAKKDGEQREDGILIDDRPTQQDLAAMVGTSRETVSRALNEFSRRGYLTMSGRRILLKRSFLSETAYQRL